MAKFPHVEWLDLYGDGTLHECAVVKQDNVGNVYFIRLRELDIVDKRRVAKILTGRNATNFALWDLLYQTTLGNGMNALEYFHQYVKVRTPRGQIMVPTVGSVGGAVTNGTIRANPTAVRQLNETAEPQQPSKTTRRTPPPA